MGKTIPLTQAKFDEFTTKLKYYETVRRTEISDAIRIAKEFGDLSENAEYTAAKDAQEKLEIEIATISAILSSAYPIDISLLGTNEISIGNVVVVFDNTYEEEIKYQLVSSYETNSVENKISDQSPIGKALVGKKVGDIAQVYLPNGDVNTFKILSISK
ncbi:MAG: transcription elongation factor GreA [Christensenellaceae bacterium]|jgi:transcription elongation factor GreA|nr:transcription elongation factor GreA [Christensenellaceae bacterium]